LSEHVEGETLMGFEPLRQIDERHRRTVHALGSPV
jgi:hypothetical protein